MSSVARKAIILLGSPILGRHLTIKTNLEIETSAQNMKTSESASFTHFPSQISATWLDTQYLDSYREDGNVISKKKPAYNCLTL